MKTRNVIVFCLLCVVFAGVSIAWYFAKVTFESMGEVSSGHSGALVPSGPGAPPDSYLASQHSEVTRVDSHPRPPQRTGGSDSDAQPAGESSKRSTIRVTSTPPQAEILIAASQDGDYVLWKDGDRVRVTPTLARRPDASELWMKVQKKGYHVSKAMRVEIESSSPIAIHFELIPDGDESRNF